MIKLYGTPVSNFYNVIKLALLEKGFEFEEVFTPPNQKEDFLAKSPLGKIPCLEVQEGFLVETNVILEFLEDINSEIPLFPENAYQRAKVRELMKVFELYIDAPVRRLMPKVFFGQEISDDTVDEVKASLGRGFKAVERLAAFEPYIAGSTFSYADIYAYYVLTLGRVATQKIYQWDLLDDVPGLKDWFEMMASRALVKSVDDVSQEAIAQFFSQKK